MHDRALLDALTALPPASFDGQAWRVVRAGRPPLTGSASGGRWTPPGGVTTVLYTALDRAGALAEIGFRLALEPVWPSRVAHTLHRLMVRAARAARVADLAALTPLGVDPARFAGFDYAATQAIAAAAWFLEFDGLIVPSARAPGANLVLFLDRPGVTAAEAEDVPVDWTAWRARRVTSPDR